jgi:predicted amidohydrolase YtcJ
MAVLTRWRRSYWGDAHHALAMGPDRAERMDACATALAHGVPLAIHSDAPITPIGPLFTAWCAVNRLTSSGRVLGASERIGVAEALRASTLGAAHTLHLDDRIGSIEVRKSPISACSTMICWRWSRSL